MVEAVKLMAIVMTNKTKPAAMSAESPNFEASPYLRAISEETELAPELRTCQLMVKIGEMII
jgi:hypothetical protein